MKTSAGTTGVEHRSIVDPAGSWMGEPKKATNGSRLRGVRRRRVPHLALGVLLVLACAAGFALVSVTAGDRQPALVLARPVVVGHVLAAPDLRVVNVAVDPGVSIVSGSQASRVVGRVVSASLPAGSLLTPDVLGGGSVPGAGRGVAALALKAGQFPPEIAPGARVSVVSVPSSTSASAGSSASSGLARTWTATVISVTGRANEQTTVVSVELGESDALEVAAVPAGQVSVVMLAAGGR
jgi:hypothetical protein